MANYGTYADRALLKQSLGQGAADTADDVRLLTALEDASRFIDGHCARWFQPRIETRTYSAPSSHEMLLDADLLSVTSLGTDDDDDRDYDSTWTASDYDLLPDNAWPKTIIAVAPLGAYTFPRNRRGVQIAGLWGYGDGLSATPYIPANVTATVATTSGTTITMSAVTGIEVGQCVLVEFEQMYVTAVGVLQITAVRAVNGTTAATHAAAAVSIYRYPQAIRRACLRIAARTWRLESAPFGVQGGAEMGSLPVVNPVDTETLHWLAPYRHVVVG